MEVHGIASFADKCGEYRRPGKYCTSTSPVLIGSIIQNLTYVYLKVSIRMFIIIKTGLSNASTTFILKRIIVLPLVGKVKNYRFGKKQKIGLKTFLG